MDILGFFALSVTGFAACAEFGSYAFVHPVLRHLPREHHVFVEKGLLKTFGRVMPTLMTLCVVLSFACAIASDGGSASRAVFWTAVASFTAALVSTIAFNVPINASTGRWDAQNPPEDWKEQRNRWEFFQAVRSWLLLIGFVLLCLATALPRQ